MWVCDQHGRLVGEPVAIHDGWVGELVRWDGPRRVDATRLAAADLRDPPRAARAARPGRTLHVHATDTTPEAATEWLIDLTGDAIVWRRAHEKAAVAVRAPLTDLLLVVYRRRPARGQGIEVLGDVALLDFWLERVGFG